MSTKKKPTDTADEQAQEDALALDAPKTDDVTEAPDPIQEEAEPLSPPKPGPPAPPVDSDLTDAEVDAALTETPAEELPADEAEPAHPLAAFSLQSIAEYLLTRTASGSIVVDKGGVAVQCVWQNGAFILDQGV